MRSHRRPLQIGIISVAAAFVAAFLWVYIAGGLEMFSGIRKANPAALFVMLAITAFCVLVRFVRWQFLLRRLDIRIPIRASFSMYLASLAGMATPAYAGEAIRAVFMHRRFDIPYRHALTALAFERLLDFVAVALIALFMANTWLMRQLILGLLGVCFLLVIGLLSVSKALGMPAATLERLRAPANLTAALLMSLMAWAVAGLLVGVAADAFDQSISLGTSVRIFSSSTLLGGVSLLPAGVIFAGSSAIVQLQSIGIGTSQSVIIVTLMRLMSVGVTFFISSIFLGLQLLRVRQESDIKQHFDGISHEYADQYAEHIWEHLLKRKVDLMEDFLKPQTKRIGLGLDLGCGLGLQSLEMQRRGFNVVGLDLSKGLLKVARRNGANVTAGSALELPFADESLDFVYCVGVLHHLPGPRAQARTFDEVRRVLRPGGLFLVHETNPRNPLFRFYMGYVFPILRSIDEGTEHWISAESWEVVPQFNLEKITYFTFLPDFIPRVVLRLFMVIEKWLEDSRLRRMSAHYLAAMRKPHTREVD